MFKKILVPIDGSRTSFLGLDEAIKLAKDQKASLYLLHILDQHPLVQTFPGLGAMYLEGVHNLLRETGLKILAKAESKAHEQGVISESVLIENVSSFASDLIVDQAKQCGADLIVLGTHGRRGIRRLALGSDAEQVVRMTPVPVLLVRSKERPPAEHVAAAGTGRG